MRVVDQPSLDKATQMYERFGRPLESEHGGEYLAVSREGETLLGPTLLEVLQQATAAFGPGNLIFKVGEKTVGKWR